MIPSLYALYDKVAKRCSHFMLAQNDAMYVRELVAHRVAFPLNFSDTVPVCLGTLDFGNIDDISFSENDFDFDPATAHFVSWTSWKYPESPADLLAPLGVSAEEARQISERKIKEFATTEVK